MEFPGPLRVSNTHVDHEKELRRQMPPLQTSSVTRTLTQQSALDGGVNESVTNTSTPSAGHQRFALTDPVAARYLEEDPKTTVLVRRQKIEGYEIYLVEQWACSRSHPTFLITTYTGNPSDVVTAFVISVPAAESEWSPELSLYFDSLTKYHARRKETPYGTLMITNLSGFPSSLTVIPIPNGDIKGHREIFFVNENLKRLGCSGRLGIKLAPPSSATIAKFHQLYRTSEKIPLYGSVIELVKLCQVALVLFGKLEPEYADGLLCDVTERAVNDWWVEFGSEYYTVEPQDGILGPTTVAALLGMLMGARNRLSACNAPVAKDVFDVESTKRGIAYFQKSQHIQRTRRLDRQTLDKLRRATAKAASKEGWAVPRAFKSTVAELGGKGGEMVMGMVGAGQKDGIAEVETVDIDRFAELVKGEHAKWLWHGIPRKSVANDMFDRLPAEERSTSPDEEDSNSNALTRESTFDQHKLSKRSTMPHESKKSDVFSPDGVERERDKDLFTKRSAIKSRLDPGNGLRHIKDAVSLRTHASKLSREEHGRHILHRSRSDLRSPLNGEHDGGLIHDSNDQASMNSSRRTLTDVEPSIAKVLTETPNESNTSLVPRMRERRINAHHPSALRISVAESDTSTQPAGREDSVAGSIYHGVELNERLAVEEAHEVPPLLRRTLSSGHLDSLRPPHSDEWWPRHLSFSIAEDHVLRWSRLTGIEGDAEAISGDLSSNVGLAAKNKAQKLHSECLKRLYHNLILISNADAAWVASRLQDLVDLEAAADADIETLDSIYYPRLDSYHALREDAHGIVTNNRSHLTASLREISNMGDKLDYEISALRSKVEDVEDALGEFERQIEFVENKADELDHVLGTKETWLHWTFRMMTGIGRPPT